MATLFWHIPEDKREDNKTLQALKEDYPELFLEESCHAAAPSATNDGLGIDVNEVSDRSLSKAEWTIKLIGSDEANELKNAFVAASKLVSKHGEEAFLESPQAALFHKDDCLIDAKAMTLNFDGITKDLAGLILPFEAKMKPLCLDFENLGYRQRLLRGSRTKEAVARAVLRGIEKDEVVFDATAGLGRESMILAHAGAKVISFERKLPVWILLHDAFSRAQGSRYFPFDLPELYKLGTIEDYFKDKDASLPSVIYYDPMFPEREERSAQVKKDMYVFQQVVGQDRDIEHMLKFAISKAQKRVVLKRPRKEMPYDDPSLGLAYDVDGGQCRFDCYHGKGN